MTITTAAYEAFCKVHGLRELARENNMSTVRTQNAILQALEGADLASVAALLESGVNPSSATVRAMIHE